MSLHNKNKQKVEYFIKGNIISLCFFILNTKINKKNLLFFVFVLLFIETKK